VAPHRDPDAAGDLWKRGGVRESARALVDYWPTDDDAVFLYVAVLPTYDDLTQFHAVLDFKQHITEKGRACIGNMMVLMSSRTRFGRTFIGQFTLKWGSDGVAQRRMEARASYWECLRVQRNVGQGYRTVDRLAKATGLSRSEVARVIDKHLRLDHALSNP
jgi:hypothetical protein